MRKVCLIVLCFCLLFISNVVFAAEQPIEGPFGLSMGSSIDMVKDTMRSRENTRKIGRDEEKKFEKAIITRIYYQSKFFDATSQITFDFLNDKLYCTYIFIPQLNETTNNNFYLSLQKMLTLKYGNYELFRGTKPYFETSWKITQIKLDVINNPNYGDQKLNNERQYFLYESPLIIRLKYADFVTETTANVILNMIKNKDI